MTRPINLFRLSRIRDEELFNIVERHESQPAEYSRTHSHEMESLRLLTDKLVRSGVGVADLDGFFFSFHIPRIGKEFDLLKFTEDICLNIELKSQDVGKQQIKAQLLRNRYYLGHLGRELLLFTVVTDTMTCYRLTQDDELIPVSPDEVAEAVLRMSGAYISDIDNLFRASDYLVSPLSTPDRFIHGEYFLTQVQDQIKKSILAGIDSAAGGELFLLTGKPGTGKTLLLYDLAKTLSERSRTLLIHCGRLTAEQKKIGNRIEQLDIISSEGMDRHTRPLEDYGYILIDETHRIYPSRFEAVQASVSNSGQICILSADFDRILSGEEAQNDIYSRVRALPLAGEYTLAEKIRSNREIGNFIMCVRNLNHKVKTHAEYMNVELNYANTTREAQSMLEYYRGKGYVFINYSKPRFAEDPYAEYEEDFRIHQVVGLEFDKVVMLMDSSFYYDENGILQGVPLPATDYIYPNMFYYAASRVREKLALVVVNAPELFDRLVRIVKPADL